MEAVVNKVLDNMRVESKGANGYSNDGTLTKNRRYGMKQSWKEKMMPMMRKTRLKKMMK